MTIPAVTPSTSLHWARFLDPYSRYRGPLEDFERGPVALSDPSLGIDYQTWHCRWEDDEQLATYGDFILTPETTGVPVVVHNAPNVTDVGLAFDQNGHWFLTFISACAAYYRWYDPVPADIVTVAMDAGVNSVACCLDDHRPGQIPQSDILLFYTRSGSVYWREERERFLTERLWQAGAGTGKLHVVGMNVIYRLQVHGGLEKGIRLSDIVGDLCARVDVQSTYLDLEDISEIEVRGYKSAGLYAAADSIRGLQMVYFFDMPMIDGKLTAVRRGGEIVATITQDDLVSDRDFHFTDSREQGVEFPKYVRIGYANAENDYTPSTSPRSERRSRDIKSQSEFVVESAVNHTVQDAAERMDILHKILWAEFEGKAVFSIPESFAERVPSNLINFEVRPGVFKRMRISKMSRVDGAIDCEANIDRQSAYTAASITLPTTIAPETPRPTLPGDTTWEFMDLPALLLSDDDGLYVRVAGHGTAGTAWTGARVQREVGADWQTIADITSPELMGTLAAALPASSVYFIDTTNSILVTLNSTPPNTNLDLMLSGSGAWLIGNEIVQIRSWEADTTNWRGWVLMRGRLDTSVETHPIGTRAVYLGNPVLVPLDGSLLNTALTLRAPSIGQVGADAAQADYMFAGRNQEEWPPEDLTATHNSPAANDWALSWVPRYRLGNSANPIPSAHFYGWSIAFTVGTEMVEKTTNTTDPSYQYTEAAQITDFGSAQASFDAVEIRALSNLGGPGKSLIEAIP